MSVVELDPAASSEPRKLGLGFANVWSPDSAKLAVEDDDEIVVYETATGRWLLSTSGCCYNPTLPVFSPDSTWAAFYADAGKDDRSHVYVAELGKSNPKDLGVGVSVQSWSPNSRRLAFRTASGVVTVARDGTARRLAFPGIRNVTLSPDWTRYAFSVPVWHGEDLYVVTPDDPQPRRLLGSQCQVIDDPCQAGDSRDNRLRGGAGGTCCSPDSATTR